ncbi:flagellar biosynthesis protein FlgN [Stutzerimonas balearica]|uniref:flagella synthesis protein FlgN n=1 Tax=Stutzerimonas balearica TaxID=74829 RepID=UPI00059767C5|nr:flagellar protein FlgN [Stutzerimonas balearica]KIL05004.1 flagellar biosynthesis protein FlgN [Stutzerimonas stutzeri]MBB62166.1 flagellar protein FlgN [Pseudomonas sp.]MBC7199087.1 flagellar protein FlgN [Stutzerimonas balearica]MCZ4128138.1 flagellar protein FlgN [Stutzerimonas balearica]OMG66178.1 flagellar biosynthesis protein FlgN [Stutzerimonas balearica]|tara:strand:- start:138 stop:608 length:471 start_codon:yes stop_codon:yes gene_type:complete
MHDENLLQQLVDDIDTAKQLLELIEHELAALAERNLAELEIILTKKQPLLALLGQHGVERSRMLTERQLSNDRSGLEAFASISSQGDAILARSSELEALLQDCQAANERNGRLIRANQGAVGSLLAILQGSNETPDLYNRRGATAKSSQHRPLSQA